MNRLTEPLPVLRRLRDPAELEKLVRQAAADGGHVVWGPSHVIEKHGELVGYIGLNSLPYFQAWFDTGKMAPRDSALVIGQVENLCRTADLRQLLALVPNQSPFRSALDRFGYRHLADAGLHLKDL